MYKKEGISIASFFLQVVCIQYPADRNTEAFLDFTPWGCNQLTG
jgi:hypothetical protein